MSTLLNSSFVKNQIEYEPRFKKYFANKFESCLPLIKQLQHQNDRMNTPFENAKRNLKNVLHEEMNHSYVDKKSTYYK